MLPEPQRVLKLRIYCASCEYLHAFAQKHWMIESGRLLSEDFCRRLTDAFSYSSDDVVWLPIVGGIPGDDLAIFADEDGRKGVGERLVVAWSDADIEILCNCGKIFFCGRGEVPVEKFFFGVVAGVGSTVAAEDLRRVVGGVEADAEEVGLVVEGWIGGGR